MYSKTSLYKDLQRWAVSCWYTNTGYVERTHRGIVTEFGGKSFHCSSAHRISRHGVLSQQFVLMKDGGLLRQRRVMKCCQQKIVEILRCHTALLPQVICHLQTVKRTIYSWTIASSLTFSEEFTWNTIKNYISYVNCEMTGKVSISVTVEQITIRCTQIIAIFYCEPSASYLKP